MNGAMAARLTGLWPMLSEFALQPLSADDNLGCKDLRLGRGPDALRLGFTVGLADEERDNANAQALSHALSDLWALHAALNGQTSGVDPGEATARRHRWKRVSPLPWAAKLEDDLSLYDAAGEQLFIFNDERDTGWANAFVIATVYVPQLLADPEAR